MDKKPQPPARKIEPPRLDQLQFNVLMTEHFHATQQCLCDMAIATHEALSTRNLAAALDARINDTANDRTEKSAALLAAVAEAVRRHVARNRPSRT
jgi:hypothetical protein